MEKHSNQRGGGNGNLALFDPVQNVASRPSREMSDWWMQDGTLNTYLHVVREGPRGSERVRELPSLIKAILMHCTRTRVFSYPQERSVILFSHVRISINHRPGGYPPSVKSMCNVRWSLNLR